MIKANELRIGNLVNVPREDQSPFRIDAFEYLSHTYIKVAMTHPEFGDKMHPLTWYDEDLKPIPLTEEWLLKFGFRQCEYFKNKFDLGDINAILIKDFCIIEMFDHLLDTHVSIKQIKYAHQLQNLYFFLTDAELTVA
jgi:hypothetical protein